MAIGQRRESDRQPGELSNRGGAGASHPHPVVARRPNQAEPALRDRQEERQDHREMAKFGDHCAAPLAGAPPCHWPARLSASATSGGM